MLARMKVGQKIGLSFAVAVLLAASTAAVAWRSSAVVADHLRNIADAKVPSVEALKVIDEAQTAIWGSTVGLISRQLAGTEMRAVMFRTAEDAFKRMDEAWARYEALPHGEEAMRRWKALAGPWGQWRRQAEATIALARDWERLRLQGVDVEDPRVAALVHRAAENVVATEKNYDAATADLRALVEQTQKDVQEKEHEAVAATSLQNALLLCGLVVSGVLLALLGTYLARTIGGVVRDLNREAKKLTDAVGTGELGVRGDAAAVNFEFRGIVEGMNATMDAFQRPIDVTVDYVTRIARGDLPPAIADRYEGDFDKIKLALNGCIAAVSGLVEEMKALSAAAVEGKLSTRADASQHDGEFGRIVEGVNGTLDAVMKPIEEATGVLEKLAARDLTARVVGSYRGDHARIKEALNGTAEALHEALEQVAQAVTQVSAAAGQIASSSQAVADGASEQASSLEETSSSLESMSSMTKQASDNAQQANGLAQTAKGAAAEGGAAMEQMTGAMGKIKASAEGTSQIIKDINEIAFQTNLLALNAAVEAARAGEAGRGFAVVAEEVRSLAMRSKEAAQKTEELIRQSVKEAGEGEVTAKHVSGKLLEIAGSISKVTDIVAEIAASAKEQAAGIDQVNKAVGQMDKVTQQNAANSEESSSAAAELAGQSEELAAMIGSFQLERTGATVKPVTLQARKAAPPPARAAPRAPRGTASRCAPRT